MGVGRGSGLSFLPEWVGRGKFTGSLLLLLLSMHRTYYDVDPNDKEKINLSAARERERSPSANIHPYMQTNMHHTYIPTYLYIHIYIQPSRERALGLKAAQTSVNLTEQAQIGRAHV